MILARTISPEENRARAAAAFAASVPKSLLGLAAACAGIVLLLGVMSGFHPDWVANGLRFAAFLAVPGLLLLPVRWLMTLSQCEAELGRGRTLAVEWGEAGLSLPCPGGTRFIGYGDVRSVTRRGADGWFLVFRPRRSSGRRGSPFVALPSDVVPPERQRAWGSGV